MGEELLAYFKTTAGKTLLCLIVGAVLYSALISVIVVLF